MADTKRKRDPQFTSPIGTFRYPKLTEPDYGTDKFPKPDGEYSVQLVLPRNDPATIKFLNDLAPVYREAEMQGAEAFRQLPVAQRKKAGQLSMALLHDDVYDKDTEEPTGDIVFKMKLKAGGVYKRGPKEGSRWTARPVVFDALGQRLSDSVAIWGGTKGRVSFSVSPYFVASDAKAGLSMRLIGAQVVKLVTAGERTADSLGFGAVEGGYVAGGNTDDDATTAHDMGGIGDDEVPF